MTPELFPLLAIPLYFGFLLAVTSVFNWTLDWE